MKSPHEMTERELRDELILARERNSKLEPALVIALQQWRVADYHWTLEFGPVPPDVTDHIPDECWVELWKLVKPS